MFSWVNNLFHTNTNSNDNYTLMHFKSNQVVPEEAKEYSKIVNVSKPNGYNSIESSYDNNLLHFGSKPSYSEPIVVQSVVDFKRLKDIKNKDDIRRD